MFFSLLLFLSFDSDRGLHAVLTEAEVSADRLDLGEYPRRLLGFGDERFGGGAVFLVRNLIACGVVMQRRAVGRDVTEVAISSGVCCRGLSFGVDDAGTVEDLPGRNWLQGLLAGTKLKCAA